MSNKDRLKLEIKKIIRKHQKTIEIRSGEDYISLGAGHDNNNKYAKENNIDYFFGFSLYWETDKQLLKSLKEIKKLNRFLINLRKGLL